jgi:selenide,water dikinase
LSGLKRPVDPNLLVGPETSDDAGVYCLTPELALAETCDIITPPVDDPYQFGRIAAANALSDLYAMGARPVTAMNLAFFPACSMEDWVLAEVLAGGQEALNEAGCCLVGGHTVEDDELKYGLSVSGTVHPGRIIRNSTARPGDQLILTKPLGSGIISTAIKGELAAPEAEAEAIKWMTLLNRAAGELMLMHAPSACTDVTGFGLIGHCCEMAKGAGVTVALRVDDIPLMSELSGLIGDGMVPAGCYRNRDYYLQQLDCALLEPDRLLPLFDPQTSGGLLIALAPADADCFFAAAGEAGIFARIVGEVLERQSLPVRIR